MTDLYSQVLRQIITESEEDSAAKYQKDIDAVKKLGEFIDKSEDKFKKDFLKYFYEREGQKDTSFYEDRYDKPDEYQKKCCLAVGWVFVDYIFKVLGVEPNEKDAKTNQYGSDTYDIDIKTYITLPFTGFDVQASVKVKPSKTNKPGKKFVFELDLDNSDLSFLPDVTYDKDFKVPDEEWIDIVQYRDYEYKNNKKNTAIKKGIEAFKSKYVNDNTQSLIGKIAYEIKDKQGEGTTKSDAEKFNKTLLKAVMKHTKLTSDSSEFKTSTVWKWETTSVYTNLGSLYVETYLAEGDFYHLEKVSLYGAGEDTQDLTLYDAEKYSKR